MITPAHNLGFDPKALMERSKLTGAARVVNVGKWTMKDQLRKREVMLAEERRKAPKLR